MNGWRCEQNKPAVYPGDPMPHFLTEPHEFHDRGFSKSVLYK